MDVRLTPELAQLVAEELAAGRNATPSEVIAEGLHLLAEERLWREEVRRRIDAGMAEARAGRLVDGEEVFERLFQRIESYRNKGA